MSRGLLHQELTEGGEALRRSGRLAAVEERSAARRFETEDLLREPGLVGAEEARRLTDRLGLRNLEESPNPALASEARTAGSTSPSWGRRW